MLICAVCLCSELCGDLDDLELGDSVEYTLSKGKGNKVSAEKVTKVTAGEETLSLGSVLHIKS